MFRQAQLLLSPQPELTGCRRQKLKNRHLLSLPPVILGSLPTYAFLESIPPVGVPGKALNCLSERPWVWAYGYSGYGTPHPTALILQDRVLPMDSQVWRSFPSSFEHYAAKRNHQ